MYDQFFGIQQRRPLADVVHAGDRADKVGGGEVTRHAPQLLRRVKMHRPVVSLAGGQQTRLVLLQIDSVDAANGCCVQTIFCKHRPHRVFHRFGGDAPSAAYTYPQYARDKPQGTGEVCLCTPANEDAQRAALSGKRTLRQGGGQGELAAKGDILL